ncbi:alphaK A1 [Puccinia graminis f. sp. tritici CRL 75-36-700-3]|uniref:AlphaK A1 n=1 Tax=Puccinia graminis f. sp. tritici (strain CRL 75-36-700-3 / race SCCL) TaxID=418459 RepID=E3KFH3_PUCGT|nr:alphaK A1 [Puccinia graminis f. sp. tritici CRL 75-36-700-3]EFP83000.2 alphaK A1 [Puccinia graminis f. sp. tritici CRL 75-36-700-3]
MPTCNRCTKFFNQLQFGWCFECLGSHVAINPENRPNNFHAPPSNIYNVVPPAPPWTPSQPVPSTQASSQVLQVPIHASQPISHPAALVAPTPPNPACAGSNAYFRGAVKEKRRKNAAPTPYARKSKATSQASTEEEHTLNIDSPNLYEDLQRRLWDLLSPELLSRQLVEMLPENPLQYTSLSHNQNVLDLPTLLLLVKKSTVKRPAHIDLTYEDPTDELPTSINTSTSTSRTTRITRTRATPHNPKDLASVNLTSVASNDTWALGGTAGTILARGDASLSTHLNYLGKPLAASININPEGWVVAQRLNFNRSDSNYVRNRASHVYQYLQATTVPITIKVDKSSLVGQGSMRKAYSAQVRTEAQHGQQRITNWVAKVRYHDTIPDLRKHATDARMYEACGHLLRAYQEAIKNSNSSLLTSVLRKKANAFELVRHCIVFVGEESFPSEVYFLEAALSGSYVKYSSNVNFAVTSNQPGLDIDNLMLMSAFTHWSYVNSKGNSLICDLQGAGSIITDPQILDRDNGRWADGNNASEGIKQFVDNHRCNKVCEALKFQPPDQLVPVSSSQTEIRNSATQLRTVMRPGPARLASVPNRSLPHRASLADLLHSDNTRPTGDFFNSQVREDEDVNEPLPEVHTFLPPMNRPRADNYTQNTCTS